MQIARAVNTTIFRLRHHLFGPGRFHAVDLPRVKFTPQRAGSVNFHRLSRWRVGPSGFHSHAPAQRSHEASKPEAWPFDTAFPSGLPRVALFPGNRLTDMPSTAAQLAKPQRAASLQASPSGLDPVTAAPGTAPVLGTLIDVFA